jgi:hypothetical protein
MINHGEESPSMDGFEQSKIMAWQRVGCGCRSGKAMGKTRWENDGQPWWFLHISVNRNWREF